MSSCCTRFFFSPAQFEEKDCFQIKVRETAAVSHIRLFNTSFMCVDFQHTPYSDTVVVMSPLQDDRLLSREFVLHL